MYGPSKETWNALMALVIMGCIAFILLWVLGPPAVVVGVAWFGAPRLGYTHIDYLSLYWWTVVGWVVMNGALIWLSTVPWPPIGNRRGR